MSSENHELGDWSPMVDRRTWLWGDGDPSDDRVRHLDDPAATGAWPEDLEITYPAATNLSIPGQGDPGDGCGEWAPTHFCDGQGHVRFGPRRCERRACPRCDGIWSGRSARRITRRLQALRHTKPKDKSRRILHLSISPPEGDVRTIQQFYSMLKDAYTLAKENGVTGGVAVPHGFRVKQEYQMLWNEKYKDEVDGGIWKWIRENDKKNWREMTYWSPHVHVIGVCPDLSENKPDQQDGWNCVRIRTLDPMHNLTDEDSYESLIGCARYILSHATYDPNDTKQLVRWFGTLAPAAFSPPEELSPGALDTIERYTEEVCYDSGTGDEDPEKCECDGCDGDMHSIFHAQEALQRRRFCDTIGKDGQRRLTVAFRWAIGELQPPPGLAKPMTEEDCQETWQTLLDDY